MITAKDLMIGDWLYAYDNKVQVTHLSILGGDVIGVQAPFMSVETYFASNKVALEHGAKDIEHLKPIPLTTEILEKNGIVFDYTIELHDDYGNPYEIKGYALHGTTKWGDDYLLQYDEDKDLHISTEIYGEITLHNINFIHELQHALRLCGIEKEIEL